MTTKITSDNIEDNTLDIIAGIKVSTILYSGNDTAVDTAGGQTITLIGAGFKATPSVIINGASAGVVTMISASTISFVAPANPPGTYVMYVANPDGSTAIVVPGISYSGTPTWSTSAGSLGSTLETAAISQTITATGDAPITYSLQSGTLPTGATLNASTGLISGSSPLVNSPTTYTFTIRATDLQQQDTDRQFSLTINPDTVTWASPANASVITTYEYVAIANTTLSASSAVGQGVVYSANGLPSGISLTGDTLSGTSTAIANTEITLTATSNVTNKTSNRTAYINVLPDVLTWSAPENNSTVIATVNNTISNVELSATSAAGFNVTYTANSLPPGISLTGSTISGTPTLDVTQSTLLTATSATTNKTGTRTINWVIDVASEANFRYTTFLMNAELFNPTDSWVTDASNNNFTITVSNEAKPSSLTPFTDATSTLGSGFFDGNGDFLSWTGNTAMNFGSNAFTIEAWVYLKAMPTADSWPTNWSGHMVIATIGTTDLGDGNGFMIGSARLAWHSSDTAYWSTNHNMQINQWYHVAVSRSSNTLYFWVNGVARGTASFSGSAGTGSNTYIGSETGQGAWFNGHISNLRVLNGTALYTTAFSVPTTTLTPISNTSLLTLRYRLGETNHRYLDSSTNAHGINRYGDFTTQGTFTPYNVTHFSYYFDGTDDYLQIADNAAFQLGTDDFTVEFFWNSQIAAQGSWSQNIGTLNSGNEAGTWRIGTRYNSLNRVYFARGTGSGFDEVIYDVNVNDGAWHHIAVTRSSGTLAMYIDGTARSIFSGSATVAGTCTSSNALRIGYNARDNSYIKGYMNNIRITKSQVLYTTTFTPSTTNLTTTSQGATASNVTLLTGRTNRFVDISNSNLVFTFNGNPSVQAFSPMTALTQYSTTMAGGSSFFDTDGDYLQLGTSINSQIGSLAGKQISFEFWLYPTGIRNVTSYTVGLFGNNTGSVNGRYSFSLTSPGEFGPQTLVFTYSTSTTTTATATASTSIRMKSWNHFAITINASTASNSTVVMYINGVGQTFTGVNLSSHTSDPGNNFHIADDRAGNQGFGGYISGFKIQNGISKVSNFAVPTTPEIADANTLLLCEFTNIPIRNQASKFNLLIAGNTRRNTAIKKFGTASIRIPEGSYIMTNSTLDATQGPFTFECWFYNLDTTKYHIFWGTQNIGWYGGTGSGFGVNPELGFCFYQYTQGYTNLGGYRTSVNGTANVWTHYAVTRDSTNTWRFFINGTLTSHNRLASTWLGYDWGVTLDQSIPLSGWNVGLMLSAGPGSGISAQGQTNGYIDDLRLTNFCRYTSSFTAPTEPFAPR